MHTFKHLFEKIDKDAVLKAINDASKGGRKKRRKDTREALLNPSEYADAILKELKDFKNDHHKPKEIYDGISRKKRTIVVPTFREQVIHHILVNALKPMFLRGIYEHAYGSIPNRGIHDAKKAVERWIHKDHDNTVYVLKMDIRKYFESIPHDILKAKLSTEIKDEIILRILFEVIDAIEVGLPLGFYTSQWISMWYLKGLDHFVKEQCHVEHYIRYMDDMVVFGNNKENLHFIQQRIEDYLDCLGLKLNQKTQIFPIEKRDLDFMGFRFFRNRTILRKTIFYKMLRKARRISQKPKITIYDMRQMLSYLGWIKSTSVYEIYLTYIKPFVNFGKFKSIISSYDRRLKKWNGHIFMRLAKSRRSMMNHHITQC